MNRHDIAALFLIVLGIGLIWYSMTSYNRTKARNDYDHNKALCLSVGGKYMLARRLGLIDTYCEVTPHEI